MRKSKVMKTLIAVLMISTIFSGCQNRKNEDDTDMAIENELVKTIGFDGKEMSYICFGKEDGKRLVILPGLSLKSVMGSAEAIVAAYAPLAEKYQVYLFDHIKEEPDGYSIEDMADDTYKAFQELGLDEIYLMGVSMGGMVSQVLTLRHPETVKALILCSTSADIKDGDQSIIDAWEKAAAERDGEKLAETFGERVYTESFFNQYKDAIIASGEGANELDFLNFLTSIEAIRNFKVIDEIDQISCPVLVIGAGQDKVLGVQASYDIIDKLNCDSYIYENYGHAAYDEAPDYKDHIIEFLVNIE